MGGREDWDGNKHQLLADNATGGNVDLIVVKATFIVPSLFSSLLTEVVHNHLLFFHSDDMIRLLEQNGWFFSLTISLDLKEL